MANSRSEQISKLLKTLSTTTPDIEAAAVVDNDGLMIASALPGDIEDDRVAAMSAALLGMSERIVRELGRGAFKKLGPSPWKTDMTAMSLKPRPIV